jgi:hypothetical protein
MQDYPPSQAAPGRGEHVVDGPRRASAAGQAPQPQWAPLGAVPAQYQPSVRPAPTAKRRRRWTWPLPVLGVVLGGALVLFVLCTALVGAGFSEMDDARQGVRAQFRETVTDTSGIGLTVTDPRTYYVDDESVVGPDEQAYEIVVTVVNGTQNPIASSLISVHARVDTAPADSIDLGRLTAQDIAPGQQLTIPFQFKVQDGPSGPLQIAVEYADNDPVIFTGSL